MSKIEHIREAAARQPNIVVRIERCNKGSLTGGTVKPKYKCLKIETPQWIRSAGFVGRAAIVIRLSWNIKWNIGLDWDRNDFTRPAQPPSRSKKFNYDFPIIKLHFFPSQIPSSACNIISPVRRAVEGGNKGPFLSFETADRYANPPPAHTKTERKYYTEIKF